jgi:UDP-N-acetylglucosamine 2-epimerase
MKVITIIGARPQFIKAAPLSKALKEAGIDEFVLHTGQHYDPQMSDIFFKELGIQPPHLNLHIHGGLHGEQTGRMLEAIEQTLIKEKPDRVLVYGDTNSTLAGALAAAKLHVPVDHVEAGLRSFNKKMPEEINRLLTDNLSTLLFTPTKTATQNLKNEGFLDYKIREVGDVMYDAVLHFKPFSEQKKESILEKLALEEKSYFLATIHRAENTDNPDNLKEIFRAFEFISKDTPIILPLHPRTKGKISQLGIMTKGIRLIDPVGYLDMLSLTDKASLILTDSGGLQKEAYFAKVPCITLRDQTEWVELLDAGWNVLVPINEHLTETLSRAIQQMKETSPHGNLFLYGEGNAAQKIAEFILINTQT